MWGGLVQQKRHGYNFAFQASILNQRRPNAPMLQLWCDVTFVSYIFILWWIISWLQYFFGVMYLRCVASLVLCICTFGMLCIGIFGGASLVRLLLCNASLVHCFLVLGAIYFWCCVFGAMHCQLYRAGLLPQWRIYFIYLFILFYFSFYLFILFYFILSCICILIFFGEDSRHAVCI